MKSESTPNRAAMGTVFLAVLIDLIGFGIVLPLIPFYARQFDASPATIGLLYSVYSLSQLFFSPLWGSLSDRIGRRPVMIISTFGASIAYLIFAFAPSLTILFFSRILAGVMGGNISAAQAYITDITSNEDRAKGMGLIGAAFGIGFMAGPALSGILLTETVQSMLHIPQGFHFAVPGIAAAIMSLSSLLMVLFFLPETVKEKKEIHFAFGGNSPLNPNFWKNIFSPQHSKGLFHAFLLCAFLFAIGNSSLYSAFPLFCSQVLSLTPSQVSLLFGVMGLVAVLIQGGLIRVLLKRFSEKKLFAVGSVLFMLGLAMIPLAKDIQGLLIFLTLMAIGGSLSGPTLNSMISQEGDPGEAGKTMGILQGLSALGRFIGPLWGGLLYGLGIFYPFVLTGLILLIPSYIGLRIIRQNKVTIS